MKKGEKTTVKVDKKLVKEAHELGFNVSKICENALKEAIRRLKGSTNTSDTNKSISPPSNIQIAGVAKSGKAQVWRTNNNDNVSANQVLSKFKEFCEVDLHLMERTAKGYVWHIGKFLRTLNKAPQEVTDQDIRGYLALLKEKSPCTYANNLASLRIFFRDFMQMGEVVKSFRLPQRPFRLKIVPRKEELRKFYDALKSTQQKATFLMFATSGLRKHELLAIKLRDIDLEKRMMLPQNDRSRTKRTWVTFFNDEAEQVLREYLNANNRLAPESRLFPSEKALRMTFQKTSKETGIHITPQVLREWFACEMGKLGVADRYVDAFCGRVPKSVLARHYTDFSPERLKEIYDKANIKVLS